MYTVTVKRLRTAWLASAATVVTFRERQRSRVRSLLYSIDLFNLIRIA